MMSLDIFLMVTRTRSVMDELIGPVPWRRDSINQYRDEDDDKSG